MALLPITITRLDADTYRVANVNIGRLEDGTWAAIPVTGDPWPLFKADTLEAALDLAAQAVTMFAPADA
jgi:hypothetical protein